MSAEGSGRDDQPTFTGRPTFAEVTTAGDAGATGAPAAAAAAIGRYRILRLIGEGGMGAVYEAEQDQPRRIVALKVIKPGLANPELLRRFAQETQALGRLQHPGIAQIYDAGTADAGYGPQPYFAMELVRGQALGDYAASHELNTRQRLELMVRICEAVHHAHQRGLIHRDLKPGNILVDETGQPKILDFGVARITDSDAQATMQTDVGQLVGTLAYMSPEQVLADPLDIDTRSDVYTLGVILYELLSGRLPYDISKKLHEVLATIREQDPSKLSTLDRTLRGDVETIAAKALEKDKTRRYASAAELGADITRHLRDEPIVAQPPTTRYQLQKFARRHKALVGGIAAVFVVLVGGVVVSTWQAVRASRAEAAALRDRDRATAAERAATESRDQAVASQRQAVAAEGQARAAESQARQDRDRALAEKERADTESATAKAVSEFLQKNLFEQVTAGSGERGAGPSVSVSGALDRAAANVSTSFTGKPLVEADLSLFLLEQAGAQLERAATIRRQVLGPDDIDVLRTEHALATVYSNQRRYADAERLLERAVSVSARTRGEHDLETLRFRFELGTVYLTDGKLDAAKAHALQAVAGRMRTLTPGDTDTIAALIVAAAVHEALKEFPSAVTLATQAYEQSARARGSRDTLTLNASAVLQRIKLGDALATKGALDQAARAEFLDNATRTLESAKASTLSELITLAGSRATIAVSQNRPQDAEAPLLEAMAAASRAGQEELSLTAMLAGVYALQKKYTDAEAAIDRVVSKPETWKTLNANALPFALRNLGGAYRSEGRFADAERHFRTLAAIMLETPGEAVNQTRIDVLLLADVYGSLERYADADQWFARLLESNQRTKGPEQLTSVVTAALGWARLKQGRYADAERTLRDLSDALVRTGPETWERFNVGSMLGASLAGQRRFADAEPLLVAGYEGMATRKPGSNANLRSRFTLREAGEAIVRMYTDWGNDARRSEWAARLGALSAVK
jgi:hypothetical protein